MNTETKKSHKLFSIIMLILIVGSTIGTFVVYSMNIIEYKQEQKANAAAYEEAIQTNE